MTPKRCCPHCSPDVRRGRDFGWTCHRRSVGKTPTRDFDAYWLHGPLPDHGGRGGYSGLYKHGPEEATGIFDATTDALFEELSEKDAEAGELLLHQQRIDGRRRIVDWLAMHPKMWPYVRLAMGYAQTPKDRKDEIRGWLRAAKNLRAKLIDEANEYVRRRIAA